MTVLVDRHPQPAGVWAGTPAVARPRAVGTAYTDLEDAVDVAAEGRAIDAAGVPYILPGILPAFGMLGFVVAYSKVGKTSFGQQLAAHVATGRDFLDRPTIATRVLFLTPEDPPEYTAYLSRHLDVPRGRFCFLRRPLVLTAAELANITATIQQEQFGLVMISSWQAVVRGLIRDENDNAAIVQVVEHVKAAARVTGVPWLIDAHAGKGEDQGDDADPSKAMRGASAASGAADYTLSLRYANGAFGTQRRLSGKGRFVSFDPLLLDFDRATGTYTVMGERSRVQDDDTWRLIVEMGALDTEPRSVTEIARRIGLVDADQRPTNTHRKHIAAALKGRPDVGIVQAIIRGQKTTQYRRLEVTQ